MVLQNVGGNRQAHHILNHEGSLFCNFFVVSGRDLFMEHARPCVCVCVPGSETPVYSGCGASNSLRVQEPQNPKSTHKTARFSDGLLAFEKLMDAIF